MYKDKFNEMLNGWENYLKSLEIKMQCTMKTILNQVVGNCKIHAIFFEYEYESINTKFEAFDNKENILEAKYDILLDEINCKTFFPKEWLDKEYKIEFEKRNTNDDEFNNCFNEFENKKCEIYEKWFQLCWNKIKMKYNNIPRTYFSIHDTSYKIDLNTGNEIDTDNIWNKND
ncbi:MAG: hypothetical protein LBJ88_01305 [Campylobacteraceae bacterium]|jgi:hypothetical protein|nr:hypothetical protein [Campylobacteraceae bacterium]